MSADAAERYIAFWQGLSADTLDRLPDFMAPDIHFRDPFNDLRGLPAVAAAFAKIYGMIRDVRIDIHDRAFGTRPSDHTICYLRWTFAYTLRSGKRLSIEGMSEIHFAADGRAAKHIDHWDAAGQVYETLPLVGPLLRAIRRRI